MKTKHAGEPPIRHIQISNQEMEDKALGILYGLGVHFRHVAKGQYVISSGQCAILYKNGVDYTFVR